MSTSTPKSANPCPPTADTVNDLLTALSDALDKAGNRVLDRRFFDDIGDTLLRLHGAMRQHHAAGVFGPDQNASTIPPELASDSERLRNEHSTILGLIDRMMRRVDSMVDRPIEDKDVFLLRGREVIAFVRRHQAEEDRLFYLAMWRDTGGES